MEIIFPNLKMLKWIDFFKKWAIAGLFFFIFVFPIQLTVNNVQYNFFLLLDSSLGPLELEATALPTEPQPLPIKMDSFQMPCITLLYYCN